MNVYTCEICGKPTRDYDVVPTPFYFTVLPGLDNDAWGKHSNEAQVCDRHVESYDYGEFFSPFRDRTPWQRLCEDVISRLEERRVPDGVEIDYFFASKEVGA